VSINDLGSRLSAIFSLRANKTMCIKADDNLDFSTVALVLDIGKGAGGGPRWIDYIEKAALGRPYDAK
jgi:hypothetical protein